MSAEAFLFNIYADDVRQEINGKSSYIGVYQGGLSIAEKLPGAAHQLFVVANLFLPNDLAVNTIQFKISWGGGEVIIADTVPDETVASVGKELKTGSATRGISMQAIFAINPLVVKKSDRLWVNAYVNEELIKGNPLEVEVVPPKN